jgi:nitroreductase
MSRPVAEPLSVLEALHSMPARRYLKTDPIPEEVIWELLDAAIRGPSSGNTQDWAWVVVTDDAIKRRVAEWYLEGWEAAYGKHGPQAPSTDGVDGLNERVFSSADHLARHIAEAPVWVFAVLRNAADSIEPRMGASIYGAVQQLMLAGRAYGIGSTLTTLYKGHEEEVRGLLGLPDDALTMALIPLGYPARGRWTQPKRRPVEQVTHWNRWGATRTRTAQS